MALCLRVQFFFCQPYIHTQGWQKKTIYTQGWQKKKQTSKQQQQQKQARYIQEVKDIRGVTENSTNTEVGNMVGTNHFIMLLGLER